jgi:methylmalonyl-CoA mutase
VGQRAAQHPGSVRRLGGGADSITVLPYDTVLGLPERLGRRLARNTQILLADESNVGRVTDPGGGSWYLESLTDQVADAVWSRFQEVERAGGAVRALADGMLHGWVAEATAERDRQIFTRRRPLTGVSMFPVSGEKPAGRRARTTVTGGERALAPRRDSMVFERLRDRAMTVGDPSVLVKTLGTRREFGARQAFVTNLLAAAGIRASDDASKVAVLTSSPKGYAVDGAAAVADLRAAVQRVLVAGRASELGDAAELVDGEVHDGNGRGRLPVRPARPARRPARPGHRRHDDHHQHGGFAMSAVPDFTTLDLGDGRPDGAPVPDGEPG